MESLLLPPPRRAHLVGIAGSGMRALADVLLGLGWQISGSDLNTTGIHDFAGRAALFQGHCPEHVPLELDELIYSDAVPTDNPELACARQRGVSIFSYAQMLARLGGGRHVIAIAGTHGKSTTTAMLAHLLACAGRDPTVVCGATPLGTTSGGRLGRGDSVLIEACEYRANFLHLRPTHAAILGIELDHIDCYDGLPRLEEAFQRFTELLPPDGFLLARHDCPSTASAVKSPTCRIKTFGLEGSADWSPHELVEAEGHFRFQLQHRGEPGREQPAEVRLKVAGRHNVLNALAAAALAWENGLTVNEIAAGLNSFAGLRRRLELRGSWRGAALVDDYAHHPTEITYALDAVRRLFPHARVWCVFQPHQAARTSRFLDQFAASLQNADKLLVAEIFRAREGSPRPGDVSAADLARQAAGLGVEVIPVHTDEEIKATLATHLTAGDVLITLGAGDVNKFQPAIDQPLTDEPPEKQPCLNLSPLPLGEG